MKVSAHRMALLAGYLFVAFVVALTATTAPASAHPNGMHDGAAMSETRVIGGDSQTVETCCHKAGTCVAQYLQFSPTMLAQGGQPTMLRRGFAAKQLASIPSATDPPPPRS